MKDKVYKIIVVIVLFSSLFIVGQEQGDSYKTFGVIPQGVKDSLHQQLNRATDFN